MTVVTPSLRQTTLSVVLIGNPNTGKTTLFNALTGLRHRVGNYAGVTVETKTGKAILEGTRLLITDVPGTYSLSPHSPDEMLAVNLLLGQCKEIGRPDLIVCILDATNLERNLYLATQVFELGVPVVLALNMIDLAESRGIVIDDKLLSQSLGVPVVPIQANTKRGLKELVKAVLRAAVGPAPGNWPIFPEAFQLQVEEVKRWLVAHGNREAEPYLLERALLDAGGQVETVLSMWVGPEVRERLAEARSQLRKEGLAPAAIEARVRYGWIAERIKNAVRKPAERRITWSDRIDRMLLHRFWGVVFFLAMMALVFQSIYTWAEPLMTLIEGLFGTMAAVVRGVLPTGALADLVADGIIGGVGNVLVFLPQIMILFGFLAILEDCGYMARAAFLMDKLMARCGLSGKSFIPMLSSFACAIPGVMAARTIEDRRDRLTTILVAPLMSCSARLPVYTLLIAAFIPATMIWGVLSLQALVLLSMYLIGLVVAPVVALALKRTVLRGEPPVFLMELPSYKWPSMATVLHRMADRGLAFIRRAGTLILATTVIIWALQYYPRPASIEEKYAGHKTALESQLEDPSVQPAEKETVEEQLAELSNHEAAEYQAQSILGRIGKAIEPAVVPLGWDWRIGMAAVASFPAREVVISVLGTIYSVGSEVDEESVSLQESLKSAKWQDGPKAGEPVFTIPVALSLMVFFALCCQCAATLAVIKRETNSWRWPVFTFVYMTGLAYVAALVVYQVGSRLG